MAVIKKNFNLAISKMISTMTKAQINTEIKKVKETMSLLFNCVEDKSISPSDRKQYYKDYLEASTYFYQLSKAKPEHNLSIA